MPIIQKHKNPLIVMVGELILLVVFCGYAASLFFVPSPAKATVGMLPFGGIELAVIPPSPIPPCPAHTVIYDFVTMMTIGIYVLPGSQIYLYGNLITPGAYVLGEYAPIPFPTCPTPYPVFPIFQVGTSLY
jgi:hypothetical protein